MTNTFSEIVDGVANTSGLKTNIPSVVFMVNRALKQLTPIKHFSDLIEYRSTVQRFTNKLILDLPQNHRVTRAIRVDNRTFAKRKPPGLAQAVTTNASHYYYESGEKLVIVGAIRQHVDIAYYRVTPSMKYYPLEYRLIRAAVLEGDDLFEYRVPQTAEWLPLNLNNPEHAKAYARHTNWLTKGYAETIFNGALSHAYNSKGATERGSRLYQLFSADVKEIKKAHQDIVVGEH